MQILKSKKLLLSVCVALALVVVLSGTFAWFTAKDSVTNHFETSLITDGSVEIVEVFTPPTEWVPGQTVTKQVAVANTGSGDVLVRVSFEEVMKLLQIPSNGYNTPATGDQVAQYFNADAYLAAPWTDTTGLTVTGASGLNIRMQKVTAADGGVAYSFVALYQIPSGDDAGKYQRVTADFDLDGTNLTVSNVKYWAFPGTTTATAAWAKFADPKTSAVPTIRPTADIDYPITDPNKKITLDYTDAASVKGAAPTDGKWWYNSADGFFYYIGKLSSGEISANLLDSLTLDPSATSEYAGMSFDLIVNMEAIQNTQAAISASTGWNLAGNTALINALSPYCA